MMADSHQPVFSAIAVIAFAHIVDLRAFCEQP